MKKQLMFVMLSLFLIGVVFAIPPIPHAFEGNVYYSDGTTLLEDGYTIIAIIGDFEISADIINGKYNLMVESDGGTIEFYISGQTEAIGNYPFVSSNITELDFTTTLTNPDTTPVSPPPNNNNGGSPGGGSSSGDSPIIITSETTDNQTNTTNEENTIGLNGNQEPTSSGITGGVIGFIKTGGGLVTMIFAILIIVIGIGVIVIQKKHKTSKNDE